MTEAHIVSKLKPKRCSQPAPAPPLQPGPAGRIGSWPSAPVSHF